MMKKLILWAFLLSIGVTFQSCGQQDNNVYDLADPETVWTYETDVEFEELDEIFYIYQSYSNKIFSKGSDTLYVYNQKLQRLGQLTTADHKRFSGTLKGIIGDTLIISSLEDFDYTSKQDGTIKGIVDNSMLQTAKVPVKSLDTSRGRLLTDKVEMKNRTMVYFFRAMCFPKIKNLKFTSDDLFTGLSNSNSFTITPTADEITGYLAVVLNNDSTDSMFSLETENEDGGWKFRLNDTIPVADKKAKNGFLVNQTHPDAISIDLSKFYEFLLNNSYIDVRNEFQFKEGKYLTWKIFHQDSEVELFQSDKTPLPIEIDLRTCKAKLKDLCIKKLTIGYDPKPADNKYCHDQTVITLEGDNFLGSKDVWPTADSEYRYGLEVNNSTKFTGPGSLIADGELCAMIFSWGHSEYYPEKDEWVDKSNKFAIENTSLFMSLSTCNLLNRKSGEEGVPAVFEINNMRFEAYAAPDDYGLWIGKLFKVKIGENTTVLATGKYPKDNPCCIVNEMTEDEVKLEDLVDDPSKFLDEKKDGVRVIMKK